MKKIFGPLIYLILYYLIAINVITPIKCAENSNDKTFISETLLILNKTNKIYHNNQYNKCIKYSSNYFNQTYIEDLINLMKNKHTKAFYSIVSNRRLEATSFLLLASLLLPEGDIVETGVYKGGSTILMLYLMREFDLCHKHLWAFDSFIGFPEIRNEDKKQKGMRIYMKDE